MGHIPVQLYQKEWHVYNIFKVKKEIVVNFLGNNLDIQQSLFLATYNIELTGVNKGAKILYTII